MTQIQNIFLGFCLIFFMVSCEDVIDVDINEGASQLVVDAWLTNQNRPQTVVLTLSQPFFENTLLPSPVLGASVRITNQAGKVFNFIDENNTGEYLWRPQLQGETLGEIGDSYLLEVTVQGQSYQAITRLNRVPPIDSLVTEFREEELGEPEGYYAEVFARDFVGAGDTYWIRTTKNNQFLNEGSDINIAFDAGFSQGGNIDGLTFISPIREGINPFREDDDGDILAPYALNDTIFVEIHSITQEAFNFLQEVQTQLTNGGLFAIPLANVRTNIQNTDPNIRNDVVGFFCVSAVSAQGAIVGQDP